MNTVSSTNFDDYLLDRTSGEYKRLHRQALVWEKITQRVLIEAGLSAGMHFLDVGCGTGDVMRLAGHIVTKAGSVSGIDIDEKIGNEALPLLQELNNSNYSFKRFDIVKDNIDLQYDFVYARFVLIHMTDPVNILKKLYNVVKPGGTLLIQDYDFGCLKAYGKYEKTSGYMRKLMFDVFIKSGKDPEMGTNLSKYFIDAGIGNPSGTDASSVITTITAAASMMKAVTFGFKNAFLQHGIATEEQLNEYVTDLDKVIAEQENCFFIWPMLNSAWIKKPL
ncbi:methyltransferase domain-containing protein [Panacibacter ginsenosidivorans]|uniref:Methyltransferase domain-containing protein n=1 Tax=Panacibacter ginsenosidivorans TaxID=1813871 RepID=A0A5B8V5R8_9BACT|nr:methyltransferase domain-containing protein [Panacibacter ginsenosidivorans]QEC66734.1 methyltransferase domain-containing protein [Panacibacter ginsenosidivorans]